MFETIGFGCGIFLVAIVLGAGARVGFIVMDWVIGILKLYVRIFKKEFKRRVQIAEEIERRKSRIN